MQDDGKLVAAGYSWQPSYGEVFALARYDG
jgi:hypothetical protein